MKYKVGDNVSWLGQKVKIVKHWGKSAVTGEEIVSVKVSEFFTSTTRESLIKPIVKIYAW